MTLEERIKEIEELSLEEAPDPYEESDLDDVISSADYQGSIDTAKQALSIIEELQNKNKELEAKLEEVMELSYQDEGRTLKIFVNNEGVK